MPRYAILLVVPFLPGCLAFGYPSSQYTPAVTSLPSDVRAFKATTSVEGMSIIMTGGERFGTIIEAVPVEKGQVEAIHQNYFAYFVGGFPVSFMEAHGFSLVLYRPGYDLIEIPSRWSGRKLFETPIDQLKWIPAQDVAAQLENLAILCPDVGGPAASDEVRRFVAEERRRLGIRPK